jgi:hypothetical protein
LPLAQPSLPLPLPLPRGVDRCLRLRLDRTGSRMTCATVWAALEPYRNRDAAYDLATFLGPFWSSPARLTRTFVIDRRAGAGGCSGSDRSPCA